MEEETLTLEQAMVSSTQQEDIISLDEAMSPLYKDTKAISVEKQHGTWDAVQSFFGGVNEAVVKPVVRGVEKFPAGVESLYRVGLDVVRDQVRKQLVKDGSTFGISEEQFLNRTPEQQARIDRNNKVMESMNRAEDVSKRLSDNWNKISETGWEARDPKIWRGSFMENPSIVRAIAMGFESAPMLGLAATVTVATKSPTTGAAVLGAMQASEQYQEMRDAGFSTNESIAMFGVNTAVLTTLEKMPLEGFMKGGTFGKRVIRGVVQEGLIEEPTQQIWSNAVEKLGWNDSKSLFDGLVESIVAGSISGGAIGAVMPSRIPKIEEAIKKAEEKGIDVGMAADSVRTAIEDNIGVIKDEISLNLQNPERMAVREPATTTTQPEIVEPVANVSDVSPTEDVKQPIEEPTPPIEAYEPPTVDEERVFAEQLGNYLGGLDSGGDLIFSQESGVGVMRVVGRTQSGRPLWWQELGIPMKRTTMILDKVSRGEELKTEAQKRDYRLILNAAIKNEKTFFGYAKQETKRRRKIAELMASGATEQEAIEQYNKDEGVTIEPDLYDQIVDFPIEEMIPEEQRPALEGISEEQKTSKAAQDITNKLVEEGFSELPEKDKAQYSPIQKQAKLDAVASLLSSDIEKAKRVAFGEEAVSGVDEQIIFNAVKNKAILEGDFGTQIKLASSPVATARSVAAQTLSAAGFDNGMTDADPVKAISDLIIERQKKATDLFGDKKVIEEQKNDVKDIKKRTKQAVKKMDWEGFVRSLEC